MVGLRLGHHSPMALRTMVVQASTSSILFAELSPHSRPLRISPQSQPQASAWVCSPNPTFQHPEPLSAVVDTLSGWVGRAGVSTPCTGLTLSSCHTLAAMFSSPDVEFTPFLSAPLRVAGPILLLFLLLFLLLSFELPHSAGILLVLLGVSRPLLIFCRGSVRIVTFADVFLIHLWREINSMSA